MSFAGSKGNQALTRRGLTLIGVAAALICLSVCLIVPGARAEAKQFSNCQPYSSQACLFPFPDNRFTRANKKTPTGRQVSIPKKDMPANLAGAHVNPAPIDRNDGFSPGSAILLHISQLDTQAAFSKTKPVGLLNMSAYKAKNAPIMVIDQKTHKRVMIYTQLDANATSAAARDLMILPGASWIEGHTYDVVLRNLKNSHGKLIGAPSWFEKLRDGKKLPKSEKSQAGRYASIFKTLKKAGVKRNKSLYAAWNFTVASTHSVTYQLLSIRDKAFKTLGDKTTGDGKVQGQAPAFTVTNTTDQPNAGVTDVQGTFQVPCYLQQCGASATKGFHYSSNAANRTPTQNGMTTADFECVIPETSTPLDPSRISLYGHGLLGGMSEVDGSAITSLATSQHITLCATNWWGLASADTSFDSTIVGNLDEEPAFIGRLEQGVLNTLFLGRLLRASASQGGLASNPDFEVAGQPVIDTSHLFYDGNSQGGIFGGLTTSVSPDITRAVLGVTGVEYGNVLVQRSTDFGQFGEILADQYAHNDQSAYTAALDIMDQEWDSADPVGYVQGMANHSLPGTPRHQVLMQDAYGDHQVSMYAGMAEAREMGAKVYLPKGGALDPSRKANDHMFYGLSPAPLNGKFTGSVAEIWDDGAGLVSNPPVGNVPPTQGHDPHGDPRATPLAQQQIGDFLQPSGTFQNVCNSKPCHTSVYQSGSGYNS